MKHMLDVSLATDALTLALWRRQPSCKLLHHADRGVPYAAAAYQALLAEQGIHV